jgi:uncharacterized SAM-binding protein YcdF (DUF218 family)
MRKPLHLYLILAIGSLSAHSCVFFGRSAGKQYARAEKKKPYDAIIVPGVPYESSLGKWSDIMKIRVYWSYYLFKQGIARNIIFSGGAVYTPYVESQIMAMYAEALGIPKENIFIESKAEHSTENLYYSYYMGKKMGFEKMAIASDPIQSRLVRRFPKKQSLDLDFIPIVYDTLKTMDMVDFPIEAEKAKVENFVSIIERESKLKRLIGTFGKNHQMVEEDPKYKGGRKD